MDNKFLETTKELFARFGDHQVMCLATAAGQNVYARPMSFVITGGRFYFQTNIHMPKYRQISVNHNVALCWQNISIEGICAQLGKPEKLPFFTDLYRKYYLSAYTRYSGMEGEKVFEVSPVRISDWCYENDYPYQEF